MAEERRKPSIDALRGLVMVLMALDHVRDYFGPTPFDPIDPEATTPGWFFMRWVTHFCAPVFVFLAGTAAWYKGRTVGASELSRWLIRRGLWLILLEIVVNNTLWFWSAWVVFGWLVQIQVLWAIGVSMICLGGLCRLPKAWAAVLAAAMILGHNLLDGIHPASPGEQGPVDYLWAILHYRTQYPLADRILLLMSYPLLPWVGVLAAGWSFGGWYDARANRARSVLVLGVALCAGFALLRFTNFYGDPSPWGASERGGIYTLLSFLNCEKYPPSLLFLAMTLGPSLIVLGLFERLREGWLRFLVVFGRVPLFFYLLHVAVIHGAAAAWALHSGRSLAWWWLVLGGRTQEGYEPDLASTYLVWALVVIGLFPLCVGWGRLKASRRHRLVDLL